MSQAFNNIFHDKWKFLIAVVIVGASIIICCGGLFAVGSFVVQFNELAGDTPCDQFHYDFLKVNLPPGARILKERCAASFINPIYTVIFIISPEELPTFQQQDPVARIDTWQTDTSDSFFSEESWQEKKAALQKQGMQLESLLYGEYSDGSILMHTLIDTSNSQHYIVEYSAAYVD